MQVWLCDRELSDCWSVEVTMTSWHHDIRVTVTRMSWGPVSRQLIRDQVSCPSVQHLATWESEQVFSQTWLSPEPAPPDSGLMLSHGSNSEFYLTFRRMAPVTWPLVCPAGGGCEYFVCILGFLSRIDRDLGLLSEESVTITRTIYNNYSLSNCCVSGQ